MGLGLHIERELVEERRPCALVTRRRFCDFHQRRTQTISFHFISAAAYGLFLSLACGLPTSKLATTPDAPW